MAPPGALGLPGLPGPPGPPGPPGGGGGGAPGSPPPVPAPAPAPPGGGGGAAIMNAQLSGLLNWTPLPNTGSPFLNPNYTLSKHPGHRWQVTSDCGRLCGHLE